MDQIEQIKQATNSLTKTITDQNKQILGLKNIIAQLFEEEDIKKCPSYELMKNTYLNAGTKLKHEPKSTKQSGTQKNKSVHSTAEFKAAGIDGIYAPQWARSKSSLTKKLNSTMPGEEPLNLKPKQKISIHAKSKIATSPTVSTSASASASASVEVVTEEVPVNPGTDTVDKIKIDNVEYYLYNLIIYDMESHLKKGEISDGVIILDNKPITATDSQLCKLDTGNPEENFYENNNGCIFKLCNDSMAQVVGEIIVEDGEKEFGFYN